MLVYRTEAVLKLMWMATPSLPVARFHRRLPPDRVLHRSRFPTLSSLASDKLTVNADLDYTLWSTFDRIVVTSNNPLFNATDEKQWHDVWCLRIGGQYKLSDQWKLRAGYVYDKSPVGEAYFDTRTPDADRQGITIGTGYATGNMTVDLAYMYLRFNKRTINNSMADDDPNPFTSDNSLNGTYKSQAQLAGITIGYKF
jgi:long-chain fatty acid transport protein